MGLPAAAFPLNPAEVTQPRATAGMLVPRDLDAVLRRRARSYFASADPRLSRALRLIPVLLHASFAHGELRDEAPGVRRSHFRSSWTRWARLFEMPPPSRVRRGSL